MILLHTYEETAPPKAAAASRPRRQNATPSSSTEAQLAQLARELVTLSPAIAALLVQRGRPHQS